MRKKSPRQITTRRLHLGMTLLELVMACAIMLILSSAAIPLTRVTIKRQKESELRRSLREMRTAIDRFKDAADRNLIRTEVGSEGYPPELETLVEGVSLGGGGGTPLLGSPGSQTGQSGGTLAAKVRFLRRIPVDPMTGENEWGLRSVQDESDARSWSGHNVFDVYSLSSGTAIDGSQYADW